MSCRNLAKVCSRVLASGEFTPFASAILPSGLSGFDIWLNTPMNSTWSETIPLLVISRPWAQA